VSEAERPEDRVRAFLALPVGEPLASRLAEVERELKARLPEMRVMKSSSRHLTLRFLGSLAPSVLEAFAARVRAAARVTPPQEARVKGLGLFPPQGPPRVLYAAVDLQAPVLAFQAACEAAALDAGLASEGRPFRPHLTLGRWKERVRRPQLPALDLGVLPVTEAVLYASALHPEGAVHTPLARFPLGG
jgi:2'-5' RNA ligase